MNTHQSGTLVKNSTFAAPSPSVTAGFGLLRVDPSSPEHLKAIRIALRAGVRVFDLGSLSEVKTSEEKTSEEKTKWLLAEIARLPETRESEHGYQLLIRGKIGHSNALADFFSGFDPAGSKVHWTYFIEGAHDTLYESFWEELSLLHELAPRYPEISLSLGVSSTRLTFDKEDPEFLSLEGLLASDVKFSAIEFPLNLYESAAFQSKNQAHGDETLSLLNAADAFGLKTYTRRPFDSFTDSQLLRLISYPDHHRLDLNEAVKQTLEVALDAEAALQETTHPKWAHRLHSQLQHVTDPEQWKEIKKRRIRPDIEVIALEGDRYRHYLACLDALLLSITLWCEKSAAERNERIRTLIAASSPEIHGASRNLAELALTIYRSMPGLTTVLVGMRSEDYVHSVVSTLNSERSLLSPEAVSLALTAAHSAIHEAIHDSLSETGNTP